MKQSGIILFCLIYMTNIFSTVGDLDTSFNATGKATLDVSGSSSTDSVGQCAIQHDGKIVVVGTSGNDIAVVRYNIDGSLDTTFNGTGKVVTDIVSSSVDTGYAIAIQPDGKIVVGGTSGIKMVVVRYNSNGSLDTTFNAAGSVGVSPGRITVQRTSNTVDTGYGIGLQTNGRIVVTGGSFLNGDGSTSFASGLLNENGTIQIKVGEDLGGVDVAYCIAIQNDNKFIVAGTNGSDFALSRRIAGAAASLDRSSGFGSGTALVTTDMGGVADVAYGITVDKNGKIILVGTDGADFAIARYDTLGDLDTTFNTTGKVITSIGAGVDKAYGVAVQSDEKILVSGTDGTDFVLARYTSAGSLDTTFNTTGVKTVDMGGTEAGPVFMALQPDNKIVLVGQTSSNNGDFAVARLLGENPPQGSLDTAYQTNGYLPFPAGSSAAYNSRVTAMQAQSDNSLFVVTQDLQTTAQSRLVKLSSTGSTELSAVTIAETGVSDVIKDGMDRVLLVGTDSGAGWIRRYTASGSFVADTDFGTSGLVVESTNSTSFKKVCQQTTGRIIVMGQGATASTGVLIAYRPNGLLDTSFGTGGIYSMASTTFDDMVIAPDNTIYVTYKGVTNIEISNIKANGSGLVAGYNSGLAVSTGWAIGSYSSASIAFDNNGKIVIGAVATSTGNFAFKRYTTSGGADASATIAQTTHLLTSSVVINQLQCDTNNRPLFVGYDSNVFYCARLQSDLTALDTIFAPYSAPYVAPGILKAMYDSNNPTDGTTPKRSAHGVTIAGDGNIIFGGYESITSTTSTSFIAKVIGDTTPYTQVARYPGGVDAPVGSIDFDFGTDGELSLASIVASGVARAMHVLSDEKILLVIDTGVDSQLVRLTSSYQVDTSFGSGTGKIALTGFANPLHVLSDVNGNIYVVGDNGSSESKLQKIAVDGSAVTWIASTNVEIGNVVGQQSSGSILLAGKNGSSGVIACYNPASGLLDTSFGSSGYYETGVNAQIISMVVTFDDSIVFAYKDGSNNAIVKRIISDGSILDPDFTFGTSLTSVSADDQIRMVQDRDGKIVVVARNDAGNFVARRYAANGADDVSTVTIALTNSSTSSLKDVISLSDGSTLILGSNSNDDGLIIARLDASFVLDSTFGSSGLSELAGTNMTEFYGIDVTADQRVLIAGAQTTGPVPYLTKVLSESTVTKVDQDAVILRTSGSLDVTYNTNGALPGILDMSTDLDITQFGYSQAKKILLTSNNSYFIAVDNTINTYITKMNSSDVQQAAFGTSGILTISLQVAVSDMLIDQSGALVVTGGLGASDSNEGWVQRYNATTGAVDTDFVVTDTLDVCTKVRQQTTGRVLVAGQEDGFGTIIAYNSLTGQVDATFGISGRYTTAYSTAIMGFEVDSSDDIYIFLNDGTQATLQKINPQGTAVVWTGSTIVSNSSINSNNHLVIDQNGDLVTVSVDTTTPKIVIKRYDTSTGIESASLDLGNGTTGFTNPCVTSIIVDIAGKIVITGYDDVANDTAFVIRVFADITSGLDIAFNETGIQSYKVSSSDTVRAWNDVMINADGYVLAVGYVEVSGDDIPYLMRLNGDPLVIQAITIVSAGVQGNLYTNLDTDGVIDISSLHVSLSDMSAKSFVTQSNGSFYIALDDQASASKIIKITNGITLDASYNDTGIADSGLYGLSTMILDGLGNIITVGTNGDGGWVQRHTSAGILDSSFGLSGTISGQMDTVTNIVEQSLGRYIVAGDRAGNGVLRAYRHSGLLDTTFHGSGSIAGEYDTGVTTTIYALTADSFDRLYIAYKNGSNIDVARLTSNGYLDLTFSSDGIISSAIANDADSASQVRIALDSNDNIIVAAHINNGSEEIAIMGYDTDGVAVSGYSQLDISGLISPILTELITTVDNKILVSGYQSSNNSMWVARSTITGALDTTFAGGSGVMMFTVAPGVQTSRVLNDIVVRDDGSLFAIGYELVGGVKTPYIAQAYNNPYQAEVEQFLGKISGGKNDTTLGVTGTNGVSFYALPGTNSSHLQVARAIAMQDNDKIVIGLDGQSTVNTENRIFLNVFGVDGLPDLSFDTDGKKEVLHNYEQEYLSDMVTLTVAGVHKAILVGYATSTTLSVTNSLVMQYNLTTQGLDSSFGGYNENPQGVVAGYGQKAFSVGLQSSGRVVVGGIGHDGNDLLVGYTSAGRLDKSFGSGGYLTRGVSPLYTHVIDSLNRIVIAYNDGSNNVAVTRILADGSGVDSSFGVSGSVTSLISNVSGNSNMRVALDAQGKIIAAAVVNSGLDIVIKRYTSAGDIDATLTITSANLGGVTSLTITQLLVDNDGKIIIIGYDNATSDEIVVIRTKSDLSAIDITDFNIDDTPGYIKYSVPSGSVQVVVHGLIHPDGRIIVVGSQG